MSKNELKTIKIPKPLADRIDKLIAEGGWGFDSRAEFAKYAFRQELEKLEASKPPAKG